MTMKLIILGTMLMVGAVLLNSAVFVADGGGIEWLAVSLLAGLTLLALLNIFIRER